MAGRMSKAATGTPTPPAEQKPTIGNRMMKLAQRGMSAFRAQLMSHVAPYEAASNTARLNANGAGPKALAKYAVKIAKIARQMNRNDGPMGQAFAKLGEAVVNTGATPRTVFRELLPHWADFIAAADPTGGVPLGELIASSYIDSELTGDLFVWMKRTDYVEGGPVPLELKVLPMEFLSDKTEELGPGHAIYNGIETRDDKPVAYWFYPNNPNDVSGFSGDNEPIRVPAGEVLHLFTPSQPGSHRGQSRAVAAMINLGRLHGYVDAEMARKKTVAMLAGFIRDSEGKMKMPGQQATAEAEKLIDIVEWEYGQLINLPAETDISFPNIQDSSGNAIAFIKLLGLIISSALKIPYELVFGDWAEISDRTAALASTYFDKFVDKERARLEHQVYNKLWRLFVDLCIVTGKWTPPKGVEQSHWYRVTWSWPVRDNKHPVQNIEGKKLAVETGFIDEDTVIEDFGYDPDEVRFRAALARARRRAYGEVRAGEELFVETEFTKRLDEIVRAPIDALLREIEQSDGGKSAA